MALNWFPEAEHGGYYAAVAHGYFKAEGLDVTIIPGGPKVPVVPQVATGQFDCGVDNADKLLLGRSQLADVVAVFVPIQDSPRCLLLHEEAGITNFDQLAAAKDFTLAMNPGQPFAQYLNYKYRMEGITQVPYPGNISQFLLDQRFGQQAYSFSEPFVARQNGAKPTTLMLSETGFNTYTSALVVSRAWLTERRDVVRKLVKASQRGWLHYLANPEPTNAVIHKENPEMGLEILAFGADALRPLCPSVENAGTDWGVMSLDRWQTLVEQMTQAGSLPAGLVTAAEAFSNEFLLDDSSGANATTSP
jgi:NitT/TauT family transport system substrate-binding protein